VVAQAAVLVLQEHLELAEAVQAVKVLLVAAIIQAQITAQVVVAGHRRLVQLVQLQTAEMVGQVHLAQFLGLLSLMLAVVVVVFKITQLRVQVAQAAEETVRLMVQLPHLVQPIRVVVVVAVVSHQVQGEMAVQVVQELSLFLTQAHKEAQAAQSHRLAATLSTHLHHLELLLHDYARASERAF
jgi:hypothetical protein